MKTKLPKNTPGKIIVTKLVVSMEVVRTDDVYEQAAAIPSDGEERHQDTSDLWFRNLADVDRENTNACTFGHTA
jgi:hypothetical protein